MSDLINRQDAIDLVEHRMKHNPMKSVEFIQGLQDAYLRVISDLKALPPAERKEKWIEHENPKNVFSIECSECGCWFLHEHLVRNSFCPNCGAKMDERREEIDGCN